MDVVTISLVYLDASTFCLVICPVSKGYAAVFCGFSIGNPDEGSCLLLIGLWYWFLVHILLLFLRRFNAVHLVVGFKTDEGFEKVGGECRFLVGYWFAVLRFFKINGQGVFMSFTKTAVLIAILSAWQSAQAIDYDDVAVAANATFTINTMDRVFGSIRGVSRGGILNNYGLIQPGDGKNSVFNGTLNNYGTVVVVGYKALSGRILNNSGANLILMGGYIDMYALNGYFYNAGKVKVLSEQLNAGFMRGKLKNEGQFLIDTQNTRNACNNFSVFSIENKGLFQIEKGSICDFGASPVKKATLGTGFTIKTTYTQDVGETRVNGLFGAHDIALIFGVVSGRGTMRGKFIPGGGVITFTAGDLSQTLPNAIGALKLEPTDGQYNCEACVVNIELGGLRPLVDYSQFKVAGQLIANEWRVNVRTRNGYVPEPGSQFTIITADNGITENVTDSSIAYDLPKLPDGRTWSVNNEGNQIVLTAN